MYLSQIFLNPRSRRAQQEAANPYELHRTLMRGFPETLPENERVLFRLEAERPSGIFKVLVQSQTVPDWVVLQETQGYLIDYPDMTNPQVKEFAPVFQVGQILAFRLKANPTVKREGKRHALYREEDQLAWLQRKAEYGGFTVTSVRTSDQGDIYGLTSTRQRLNLHSVQFDGVLVVSDPSLFGQTLQTGIGPAKGIGFGLLSVATAG